MSKKTYDIINEGDDTIIGPHDINTSRHFFDAFYECETEDAARFLVLFDQKRFEATGKLWQPFKLKEMLDLMEWDDFDFFELIQRGYIVRKRTTYHFTDEFVKRCFTSSPKRATRKRKVTEKREAKAK